MKLKKVGSKIGMSDMVKRMKEFDDNKQGRIQIHHFINILKHNYSQLFDHDTLIGLQFELECLSPADNCVDYEEFVKIFIDKSSYQNRDDMVPGLMFGDSRQKATTF